MRQALGRRINELRNEKGMTQEGLCVLIGMDRTYLATVETGERNISIDNLLRIAEGLDTTPALLCRNVDNHVVGRMYHA